jgi:hypothetical protein
MVAEGTFHGVFERLERGVVVVFEPAPGLAGVACEVVGAENGAERFITPVRT